jgi:hypothetical protein
MGTTGVEIRYEEKDGPLGELNYTLKPAEALVSGVDGLGQFRIRMEAVEPNHSFRFHIAFERRLPGNSSVVFRELVDSVLRQELTPYTQTDMSLEKTQAMRQAVVFSLQRAMNDGQLISSPRVKVTIHAPGTLLDDEASAKWVQDEWSRLSSDVVARQAERAEGLRLYLETVSDLESELSQVSSSPDLKTLMTLLQQRPEIDPRNPRNVLFLSEEASQLGELGDVELAGVAKGLSLAETPVELSDTFRTEDADAIRARYSRTARALRELREWLESLVSAGAPHRRYIDDLLDTGDLSSEQVQSLQILASVQRGPIRRSQQWAETLEVYVYDVQRSLAARDRAFTEMVAGLEAQALGAVLRHFTVTEEVSSQAGLYVSMDIGAVYPPELERAAAYIGVNVYFRPVNKKAPLRVKGTWKHRLAATFGITVTDLKLEDETRYENLLGGRSSLLIGLGYRLTRSIRVGGGALLFLKNDPNPLVTDRSLGATPHISFSFDVDLIGALRSQSR